MCAGGMVVASLIAADCWLGRGGAWRLGLALLGTVAALAALDGRPRRRAGGRCLLLVRSPPPGTPAALLCLGLTACLVVFLTVSVRHKIAQAAEVGGRHPSAAARAFESARSTAMAIPEILILRNLGIDATVTGLQGAVICAAVAWCWSRGGTTTSGASRRPGRSSSWAGS